MKNNSQLQQDVMNELKSEPVLNTSEIGVTAKDGIISLFGHVDSYHKSLTAEQAAKRVAGVHAVALEIEVILPVNVLINDDEIAHAAVTTLHWDTSIPDDKIQLVVKNGIITLEGELEWQYQKNAAAYVIRNIKGVKKVNNNITIKTLILPAAVEGKIKEAFERNALLDAARITVKVEGSKLFLEGEVRSWAERDQANDAAWAIPGIVSVIDHLTISASIFA